MKRPSKIAVGIVGIVALVTTSVLATKSAVEPSQSSRQSHAATTPTACSSGPATTTHAPGVRWDKVKADQIASSPRCSIDVPILWNFGYTGSTPSDMTFLDGQERLRGPSGSLQATTDFSEPICHATTGTIRAYWRNVVGGGFNLPRGSAIPWDASCHISGGSDGNVGIIDANGHEVDTWIASTASDQIAVRSQFGCSIFADANNFITAWAWVPNGLPPGTPAFDQNTAMCSALIQQVQDAHGKPADVRTYLGNSPGAAGSGVIASYDLPSAADIAAAKTSGASDLGHVLKIAVGNTMVGPVCPANLSLTDPKIGTTCSIAVAPAGKVEGAGGATAQPNKLPEGSRFVLVMTDAQVTAWLDAHAPTEPLRSTLRLIINTMRVYGFYIGDTSSGPMSLIVDGNDPPAWAAQGIPTATSHLVFRTLITGPGMIRETAPPTNQCVSGPSVFACKADTITQ